LGGVGADVGGSGRKLDKLSTSSDILQAIGPLARLWRRSTSVVEEVPPEGAEQHYRDGLLRMRRGDAEGALQEFDKALARHPGLADAVVARAELLDGLGRWEEARHEYERARRLWSALPAGAPDRRYLFRRRGDFAFEVEAYDLVRANVRNKVLPQLAYGNAQLLRGRPKEALDSYERALRVKPDMPELLALKGEALSAMGRYDEAIEVFDRVLAVRPADAESLNARGIAHMALGKVAEANQDWRRQLEFLPATQSASRACAAMRQANYEVAFKEFGLALAKEPVNPYWLLYRLTAGRLIGAPLDPIVLPAERLWPTALLALRAGQASEQQVLASADTGNRRAEALFQLGVVALAGNPAAARTYWSEIAERGGPSLIEFAAARNELVRLGA
jgi:Flp pilus assembly protein TadD